MIASLLCPSGSGDQWHCIACGDHLCKRDVQASNKMCRALLISSSFAACRQRHRERAIRMKTLLAAENVDKVAGSDAAMPASPYSDPSGA